MPCAWVIKVGADMRTEERYTLRGARKAHIFLGRRISWCASEGSMASNENWFLFLLIVMSVFAADGNVSSTETAVMLAILFALTVAGPTLVSPEEDRNA